MSVINLNDNQYKEKEFKPIFNNGEAGVVKNCDIRIERKSADDKENAPDYNVIVTDNNDGELKARGYYKDFDNWKQERLDFFVKEMKHMAKVFEIELPMQFNSYEELLDTTMKLCNKNQNNIKVNIAVCYGNIKYANKYLKLDSYWHLHNVKGTMPVLGANAIMVRPIEDEGQYEIPNTNTPEDPKSDLPWDVDKTDEADGWQ